MADTWTWAKERAMYDRLSDEVEDWQGVPVLLDDLQVRVHDRHPLKDFYRQQFEEENGLACEIVIGGPEYQPGYDNETIVNSWFSWKLNVTVVVYRETSSQGLPPRYFTVKVPRSPDGAITRFDYWLRTLGASDAWELDAEMTARAKLRAMLSDRQWRHYELTGSFLETSPRSRLTYFFRRSRPTVAMTPRAKNALGDPYIKVLAVLCMHPIGYYDQSWAGCMVPSDDVIAHLTFMRADEAGFWKVANQHEAWKPEAGL